MNKKYLIIILFFLLSITMCSLTSKDKVLIRAVEKNKIEKVNKLISNGAYINAKSNKGETALIIASKKGNKEIVELLISSGADITFRDRLGNTPLITAGKNGHTEIIKILLKKDKNIDSKNLEGENALTEAINNGHLEAVKILLENGADINVKNKKSYSVVIMAASDDRLAILKYLVEKGADIYARNRIDQSAYQTALINKQIKTAEFIESAAGKYAFLIKDLIPYKEILKTGIAPKISKKYKFPCSKQPKYECFGYAVKHIVDYKYNHKIDVQDSDIKTGRDTSKGWSSKDVQNFLDLHNYNIDVRYTAAELFASLMKGEPVVLWYQLNEKWGHWVSAYSFDNNGIWTAESLKNKRQLLPYSRVFDESGEYLKGHFMIVTKR